MVEENGNNCLPQLVTSIVIPRCRSINNSDDGVAIKLAILPQESHLTSEQGVRTLQQHFPPLAARLVLSRWD